MRIIIKLTIIAALLMITSGCATFNKIQDKGAKEVAKPIIKYCQSIDADYREDFRGKVNKELKKYGIRVRVYCEGEGETDLDELQ